MTAPPRETPAREAVAPEAPPETELAGATPDEAVAATLDESAAPLDRIGACPTPLARSGWRRVPPVRHPLETLSLRDADLEEVRRHVGEGEVAHAFPGGMGPSAERRSAFVPLGSSARPEHPWRACLDPDGVVRITWPRAIVVRYRDQRCRTSRSSTHPEPAVFTLPPGVRVLARSDVEQRSEGTCPDVPHPDECHGATSSSLCLRRESRGGVNPDRVGIEPDR